MHCWTAVKQLQADFFRECQFSDEVFECKLNRIEQLSAVHGVAKDEDVELVINRLTAASYVEIDRNSNFECLPNRGKMDPKEMCRVVDDPNRASAFLTENNSEIITPLYYRLHAHARGLTVAPD
jgi:hypothetical protein